MFGFFKNKNKDKVVTKERVSDGSKDKKKDKTNKEEKDAKVTVRKGKEDKASKSIFRKSRSIEGNEEPPVAAKKRKTLEAVAPDGWPDKENEDSPHCGNGTEGEDATHSSNSSSEGADRSSSSSAQQCHDGCANGEQLSLVPQTASPSPSERDSQLKSGCEYKKYGQNSIGSLVSAATKQCTSVIAGAVGYSQFSHDGGGEKAMSRTRPGAPQTESGRLPGNATPLAMKPPLNPRVVAPRGPLAALPHTATGFTNITPAEVERDESRHTPSPGVVTPPSSPGLPCGQAVPPYPVVTGPASRPTSPDGQASMLSTPSSSTSSLSSLTARPISPSGRRTPPGPRMGTGGKLTSSPTTGRKTVRTNIKTNPTVVSRRAGSRSPVNTCPSPVNPCPSPSPSTATTDVVIPCTDDGKLKTPPSSPNPTRRPPQDQTCTSDPKVSKALLTQQQTYNAATSGATPPSAIPETTVTQPPPLVTKTPTPLPTVKPRVSSPPPPPKSNLPCEVKAECGSKLTPRSVSPTAGKSRHSVASMHSLESIPENDSDGQTSANDTLERNCKIKVILGSKSPDPLPIARENEDSANSGMPTSPARRLTTEASYEGQHHGVISQKKSSPVNEERLSHNSQTKTELNTSPKVVEGKGTSGAVPQPNSPPKESTVHHDGCVLENSAEKSTSHQKKEDKNDQRPQMKEHVVVAEGEVLAGRMDSAQSRTTVSGGNVFSQPSAKGCISSVQGKVCVGDSNKSAAGSLLSKQPTVKEAGIKKIDVGREREDDEETKDARRSVTAGPSNTLKSSTMSSDDGETSGVPTHVVFRIPLRRSPLPNGKDTEKRISAEILLGREAKESSKEREHRKERPRSVSTSRELGRERNSELLTRRRLASEGADSVREYTTIVGNGEAKERARGKVCRRSSSASQRHRSRGTGQTSEETSGISTKNDDAKDSNNGVIAPWRRSTRSRSRVSKTSSRTKVNEDVEESDHQSITSNDSHFRSSLACHRTRSLSTGRGTRDVQDKVTLSVDVPGNGERNNVPLLMKQSRVTAPPRHRSKSRGVERRLTSSSFSENKRVKDDTELTSTDGEYETRRRAQSSSRVSDTFRHSEEANANELSRPTLDRDAGNARKPPRRRRSLSSSRRSLGSLRTEREDGLRPVVERSQSDAKDVKVRKMFADRNENKEENVRIDSRQITEIESGNKQIKNSEMDDSNNKSDIGNSRTNCSSDAVEAKAATDCPDKLKQQSVSSEDTTAVAESSDRNSKIHESKSVKRSVQQQTSVVHTASQLCQTDDDGEAARLLQDTKDQARKELAAQEERYQKQVDQLTISLAEKQEEVTKLTQSLETLKEVQETLANSEELQEKLSLLQQDVRDRAAQVDSLGTELQYSKNEVELTKSKLKKLEEDLDTARQKNVALQNQITATANCDKTEELEAKIKSLEETLKSTEEERDKLSKTMEEIDAEREEEIKIIQDALDEAAQEREELIATFEKEFQNINTRNSNREQQLMEDFEWKLREMEKDHKKKLEERDRKAEERINAVRNMVESELADSLIKVAEDRRIADEQLSEVGHLKSYEAEVIQLRGVTHELQKALRASAREMEHLKMREKILEEEVRGLKKAQPSRQVGQNTLHRAKRQAEEAEAEFRQKQEKMKNELNAEWEDKLRSECSRLKAELDDLHAEEKHLAVESMKVQKEQEIRALKQSWELRQEEMTKEISTLKDSLTDKDAYYHKELENMRTNADRDVWELRRKLQRLDEKNWTQQEYLQEKHHEEMERLRADYKERVEDLEARLAVAMQNSDEDSRAQMEKTHNDEMEHLCEQHRLSMERLREELEAEKYQAVEEARVIVSKHLEYINSNLREQLAEAVNNSTQYREELEAVRSALAVREEVISTHEEELAKLRGADVAAASSSDMASQSSLASSSDSGSSNSSCNSQDRLSLSESLGASVESQDDAHKSGGSSLLGKVFGGGWFSSSKTKESTRRGSAPAKQSS